SIMSRIRSCRDREAIRPGSLRGSRAGQRSVRRPWTSWSAGGSPLGLLGGEGGGEGAELLALPGQARVLGGQHVLEHGLRGRGGQSGHGVRPRGGGRAAAALRRGPDRRGRGATPRAVRL